MNYISVVEVAKIVRRVLKSNFPGVKFSVKSKSFSMGTSIDINWENGPTVKQVDNLVKCMEYYDGMDITDLAHYKDYNVNPETGEKFKSGAKFIHAQRTVTDDVKLQVAEMVCQERNCDMPEVKENPNGTIYFEGPFHDHWHIANVIRRAIGEWTAFPETIEAEEQEETDNQEETTQEAESNEPAVTHEGDWTWVTHESKPEQEVIDHLKSLGFRWSKKRMAWYAREIISIDVINGQDDALCLGDCEDELAMGFFAKVMEVK